MKTKTFIRAKAGDTYSSFILQNILFLSNRKFDLRTIRLINENYNLKTIGDFIKLFGRLNINAQAAQGNLEDLAGVNNYVLLFVGGRIEVVSKIESNHITILDDMVGWIRKPIHDLNVTGPIKFIALELKPQADFQRWISVTVRNNRLISVLIFAIVPGLFIYSFQDSLKIYFLMIIGLIFSLLSIWESLGQKTSISFCDLNNSAGCGEVLNSKYGKFLGVNIIDGALAYFIFHLFSYSLLIPDHQQFLKLSALFAVALTIYLFTIQIFALRIICTLCIAIGLINLLTYFEVHSVSLHLGPFPSWTFAFVILAVAIGLATLLRFIIKQIINGDAAIQKLKEYRRLIPFESIITERSKTIRPIHSQSEIFLGNPEGAIRIDLFMSLSCEKCHLALANARDLVKISNNVKIVVSLVPPADIEMSKKLNYVVNYRVLKGNTATLSLLESSSVRPISKLSTQELSSKASELLTCFREVIKLNEIRIVPAIAINNKLLDREFQLHDLMHFVCNLKSE